MIKLSAKEEKFFNDVIYDTLQLNDYDLQCFVACEELAELIKAISKAERFSNAELIKAISKDERFSNHDILDNYYEFIEEQLTGEIADVYIMLAQLLRIFNISDSQIKEKIIKKLERQADRNKKAEDL